MSNNHLSDFDYYLPDSHIAQTAAEPRDSSRLLVIHRQTGQLEHRIFRDLPEYLRAGDALVLNQTRVIPARIHAHKSTGGAAELLLIREVRAGEWLAMVGGKRIVTGTRLILDADESLQAEVIAEEENALRIVRFNQPIAAHLHRIGEMPLPPYITQRLEDAERYQTVYSRSEGSAAAPTAGLHFTPELLLQLREMGVQLVYVTLHVGLGTFLPVQEEQIAARKLHTEYAELTADAARILNETKLRGGRVIAVGTTSVRTIETGALHALGATPENFHELGYQDSDFCPWKPISAFAGSTDLFIMPGFRYRAVDALITNFHLPKTSLLMLVSAFANRELIMKAYETAIAEGYRFFSLGDATLML